MAVLPQTFPTPTAPAVASYDYTDIAEGTGITKFYGFVSKTNPITPVYDGHLSKEPTINSSLIESISVTLAASEPATKMYDKDFDLAAFNMPKTLKGTGYFNCGVYYTDSGAGAYGYVKIRIKKNDDTLVLSPESEDIVTGVKIMGFPFTIPTTHFKRGDVLRMTVELWGATPGVGAITAFQIGHDPMNRDGTNIKPGTDDIITQLLVWVPFRLDI